MATLADLIETRRKQRLMTQEDAAETCGISHRSWQRYAAGDIPGPHNAKALAAGLQIEIGELRAAMGNGNS